ncbi:unnamed protein product [Bursaphelenchus xylophilus]|uniref:(pine wood nematode) hypothetical protein n=1 Tax=Bursaphelenchus xylophilus TaxID=6326 RepID=A0A1I7S1T6_BURXY|nr:unnamed protein product [Bursaphelenchus xylophilus]CAG9089933.1 unnamed protein product [Bursaphelenchus xylophilus]
MFVVDEKARKFIDDLIKDLENRREIEKILEKSQFSTEDFDQISELLPENVEYYKFLMLVKPKEVKEERPPPTKEYLDRIERLKLEAEKRDYDQMVSSVDSSQNYGHTAFFKDFGKELKESNRHVIGIVNMMITVFGGFMFGFYGISMAYPAWNLDSTTRTLLGLGIGTIFFFVDLYFFVKTLDEESKEQAKNDPKVFSLNTKGVGHENVVEHTTKVIKNTGKAKKKAKKLD